ncbi:MAG TPA: glycosyltransferase [Pyrinomonadaceae bacterium]|nr:glycosyltransferase [Pyrinomonadaceae bacterium]
MKISVIVPVRNEEKTIATLLDALLSQSLPATEIAITDGGSTDATTSIIQSYIDKGAPIRLIRTTKALPGRGRNLAIEHSSSEWLAFTDAGIEPQSTWLASLAEKAADDAVDVVFGSYEPKTNTFFQECAAIAYITPPTEIEGRLMRHRSIASTLMRRSVWEAVGGFPENLRSAEDLLFMNRIEAANFRIRYAPLAVVRWELQPTLFKTFKRFAIYSRNNIRAGLWKDWQAAVFTRYVMLMVLLIPAYALGWSWVTVPITMWILMLLMRAVVSLRRNQKIYPAGLARNFLRLLMLLPLLTVIDLGAIVGTIQWFFSDKLLPRSESVKVSS